MLYCDEQGSLVHLSFNAKNCHEFLERALINLETKSTLAWMHDLGVNEDVSLVE